MAKSRSIQTNFASGELSPLLKGRTDLDQYYQGVETRGAKEAWRH